MHTGRDHYGELAGTGDQEAHMSGRSGHASSWYVPCLDVVGRERRLLVRVSDGRLVMLAPPGESASLAWTTAQELRRLLDMGVREILRGSHVQP